jgi:hypothetical protein
MKPILVLVAVGLIAFSEVLIALLGGVYFFELYR